MTAGKSDRYQTAVEQCRSLQPAIRPSIHQLPLYPEAWGSEGAEPIPAAFRWTPVGGRSPVPRRAAAPTRHMHVLGLGEEARGAQTGRERALTVLADQEVQVAVGIGHSHFGLHLWPLQGGEYLPWTALLGRQLHFAQSAAHGGANASASVHRPCRADKVA